MMCVVCYELNPKSRFPKALLTVNGHSVCEKHVGAAKASTIIGEVMEQLLSEDDYDVKVDHLP